MDIQGEKLKWLNRNEPEMLSTKNVGYQEKENISDRLRTLNIKWKKVCIIIWKLAVGKNGMYCILKSCQELTFAFSLSGMLVVRVVYHTSAEVLIKVVLF